MAQCIYSLLILTCIGLSFGQSSDSTIAVSSTTSASASASASATISASATSAAGSAPSTGAPGTGAASSAVTNSATSAAGGTSSSVATGPAPSPAQAPNVNCSEGKASDWNGVQNTSSTCASSTCWSLITYNKDDKISEIKTSCKPKEASSTCISNNECSYANDLCECCCLSGEKCNNKNFESDCKKAKSSNKGTHLSPYVFGMLVAVLINLKTYMDL